jgi:hypothetical protein
LGLAEYYASKRDTVDVDGKFIHKSRLVKAGGIEIPLIRKILPYKGRIPQLISVEWQLMIG